MGPCALRRRALRNRPRYSEYEILGPPEIRDVEPDARYFNPAGGERRMDRTAVGNVGAVIAIAGSAECRRLVVAGIAV